MFEIPEKGTRYRKKAVCADVALSDPRRNETLHVFASEMARHAMYEVAGKFIRHNTYHGERTGTMELDIVIMTQAEYAELARECYMRGMQDASMEAFYREQLDEHTDHQGLSGSSHGFPGLPHQGTTGKHVGRARNNPRL